jgi:hypothetical protein
MTEPEDNVNAPRELFLELADGGGLLLRDPEAPLMVQPPYLRARRLKLLPFDASRHEL